MKATKAILTLALALVSSAAVAQIDAGKLKPEPSPPFTMTQVSTFNFPWKIAFLPDGRMLITEKVGPIWLVTQKGEKTEISGVPQALKLGMGGMLGVFLSPHYATDHNVYLTYAEPGEGGAGLALARGRLAITGDKASLEGLKVIWRAYPKADSKRGNFGAKVAFSPDGKYLFLSVGDTIRMSPAQDPNVPTGKILRLTLDGKPAPGNPGAGKLGTPTVNVVDWPANSEEAKNPKIIRTDTLPGPNLTPAETWSMGHRTPYGLAFSPDGKLWEVEHGPFGGDELNLIEGGKNYGWPLVSYGTNYDKTPIPKPETRPDLVKPVIYWVPVIAPGSLTFYKGAMFPQWNGNGFITGMASMTLNRIIFDGKGGAKPAERWDMGHRIRNMEVAPDGAIWAIEDDAKGALWRITP